MGFGSNPLSRASGGRFVFRGDDQVLAALRKLEHSAQRKTLRVALNAGGAIIKRSMKEHAERMGVRDSGMLIRSISVLRAKPRYRGEIAVVIRPKSRVGYFRRTKRGKLRGVGAKGVATAAATSQKLQRRNPARYAHLVELGRGGANPVSPRPFMRAAYDRDKGLFMDVVRGRIWASIHRAAKQLERAR